MKNLPKHTDGFFTEEVVLECQVNSHKAIVHWYKGEDQIEVRVAVVISRVQIARLTLDVTR